MLKILHKGTQISLDIDPAKVSLDPVAFSKDAYVLGLVAGRLVSPAGGFTVLADGAAAGNKEPVGLLINDTEGYFYENKPALASGKVGVAVLGGGAVFVSDQIDTSETFVAGDKLYAGTSTKVGLITKTAPTGATVIGIALSAASSASPELTFVSK